MLLRTLATLTLVLLSACTTSSALTEAEQRDVDAFVAKTLRTLPELPGVGVAVVRDGKPFARGYGYADLARRTPMTADTGFYNGSNTKAYTAAVVVMLAREGLIDLDAPVTKYLPELRFPDAIAPSQTTLRRFLSHTSEIANSAVTFRTAYTGEHTPELLIRILGMSRRGKEGFRYDNLGYVVASLVIERVTGKKWQDVLDERLFTPLGMERTTAYMSEARKHAIASPHDMDPAGNMRFVEFGWKHDSMMHAAGGIVTTPVDVAKFLRANLEASPAFAETHRQQAPAKRDSFLFDGTGYGFGWYQSDLHGEKLLYHGGGFEGWRSVYSLMPERKLAVGALTNAGFSHSPLELVSAYIYDRLLNVPDVEKTYDEKLAQIRARFDTVKQNRIAEAAKRAERVSMLKHPPEAYVGSYENPAYGTFTIEQRGETLIVSIGRLSAPLEPYTDPESARAELSPGTGEVLQFVFSEGAKADALKWSDEVFTRKVRV